MWRSLSRLLCLTCALAAVVFSPVGNSSLGAVPCSDDFTKYYANANCDTVVGTSRLTCSGHTNRTGIRTRFFVSISDCCGRCELCEPSIDSTCPFDSQASADARSAAAAAGGRCSRVEPVNTN